MPPAAVETPVRSRSSCVSAGAALVDDEVRVSAAPTANTIAIVPSSARLNAHRPGRTYTGYARSSLDPGRDPEAAQRGRDDNGDHDTLRYVKHLGQREAAPRAALVERLESIERQPRQQNPRQHAADDGEAIAATGRRGDARRARTESGEREADAEDQAADELRQRRTSRARRRAIRSSTPRRASQNVPSIAVTIAVNITLKTVKSVR